LIGLKLTDAHIDKGYLKVIGKGAKERVVAETAAGHHQPQAATVAQGDVQRLPGQRPAVAGRVQSVLAPASGFHFLGRFDMPGMSYPKEVMRDLTEGTRSA